MNIKPFPLRVEDVKVTTSTRLVMSDDKRIEIDKKVCLALIEFYGNMQTIYLYNEAKKATEENPNDEFQQLLHALLHGQYLENVFFNFIVQGISAKGRKYLNDITGNRDIILLEPEETMPKHKVVNSSAFDEYYCTNTFMENTLKLELDFLEDFSPKSLISDAESVESLLTNQFMYKKTLKDWNKPADVVSYVVSSKDNLCTERFLTEGELRNGRMILTISFNMLVEFIQNHMCNMQNKELREIAKAMLKPLREEFPVIFNGISKPCKFDNICIRPPDKSCGLCKSAHYNLKQA